MPIQADFILRRLAEMAQADPGLRGRQPWKAAYDRDHGWFGTVLAEHYAGNVMPRAGGAISGLDTAVISVTELRKRYGNVEAVRGIDLAVQPGEVFAFLGPNRAGKTTTVEMLEGYRRRDGGDICVLGVDPAHPTLPWRARIGLELQTSHVPPELTVWELVEWYARYYPRPRDVGETIGHVGLSDKAKARSRAVSAWPSTDRTSGLAISSTSPMSRAAMTPACANSASRVTGGVAAAGDLRRAGALRTTVMPVADRVLRQWARGSLPFWTGRVCCHPVMERSVCVPGGGQMAEAGGSAGTGHSQRWCVSERSPSVFLSAG
jgi:hypothetical protein